MQTYDAIVIGCGGMGSSIVCALAQRGVRVLGVDQHAVPHCRGSSHGQTRIIRQAYFEHPDYVPLLLEAYRQWVELEACAGQKLLHQTGLLQVGPPDGFLVPGVRASADAHQLPIETFTGREIAENFPGFHAAEDCVGLFERQAGYLLVEEAISAYLDQAINAGAQILTDRQPARWSVDGQGVRVAVGEEVFAAGQLVVAAGSWTNQLVIDLGVELQVVKKHMYWFANESSRYRHQSPVFFYETPQGYFYGFPQLDARGIKVADHRGGERVADPGRLDATIDRDDQRRIEKFLCDHLPDISPQVTDHQVCMYTRSPDEHFIIDRHPHLPQVVLAAGFSGHGYKFAPVVGRAVADIVTEGKSPLPIDFFALKRFAGATGSDGDVD